MVLTFNKYIYFNTVKSTQINEEYAHTFDTVVTLSNLKDQCVVWNISYSEYDSNNKKIDLVPNDLSGRGTIVSFVIRQHHLTWKYHNLRFVLHFIIPI